MNNKTIIGRHPAFYRRGGFSPTRQVCPDLFNQKETREAANRVLEGRGIIPPESENNFGSMRLHEPVKNWIQ